MVIRAEGFWWLSSKESPANAEDEGLIPGSGRSPGEGNGTLLQHSYLENSMDRGAWWAMVHGVAKELDMTSGVNNNNQSRNHIHVA